LSSRETLRALLSEPVPHEIVAAADATRREHFGARSTVSLVDHLDSAGAWETCPLTGFMAPGGFATDLEQVSDRTTDLVLLPVPGASLDDLASLWGQLPPRPAGPGFAPTAQLGTTDTWIVAIDASGAEDAAALAHFAGLQIVSDGVFPSAHPVRGPQARERWERFWRAAAAAGLRGHATVLYGPGHDLDSVFKQLDVITAVQRDTGVFLSVAPCIFRPDQLGAEDALLTQASLDLRVWAACRLDDTGVEHVSLRYERSDLKSAHTALCCGVDDLIGHLYLGDRDKKTDTESVDLSVREMDRWLREAGLELSIRNGRFDTVSPSEVLT
jgi:hypothetical protein